MSNELDLFGSWAQAIWETDADGVVVTDSPSWRAYTGQTLDEWLGYGWMDAIHPDDRAYAERQWREAVAARALVNAEFRLRSLSGGWRWTNVRAAPLIDAEGRIEKWAGMNIDIDDRKRAEDALRASEEKYRTLFESIDEGFCVLEILYDEKDEPRDCRYVQVNPAFLKQTGQDDPTGKLGSEYVPASAPTWLATYDGVVRSGDPVRFEQFHPDSGQWYSVYASIIGERGSRLVASVFADITVRKLAELNSAFLDSITKDLAGQIGPDAIIELAAERLVKFLNISACAFTDIDEATNEVTVHYGWTVDGVPSLLKQTYKVDEYVTGDFLRDGHANRPFIVRDTQNDPRVNAEGYDKLKIGSTAAVPFHWQGRWTNFLSVTDTRARDWTDDEIALLRALSERVFLRRERARTEAALAASETRLSAIYAQAAAGLAETATDGRFIRVNPEYCRLVGRSREELLGGLTMQAITHPDDRSANRDQFINAVKDGAPFEVRKRYIRPDGSEVWVHNSVAPIRGADGRIASLHAISTDISRAVQAEIVLRDSEERQAFLLKLSDALRSLTDPVDIQRVAARVLRQHLGAGRVTYWEFVEPEVVEGKVEDVEAGWPSFVGNRFRYADFEPERTALYRKRRPMWRNDVQTDPDLSQEHRAAFAATFTRSFLQVTLEKNNQPVLCLVPYFNEPHTWTNNEIEIVEEVADRTWAAVERARAEDALRESEQRLQQFGEASQDVLWIRDAETLRWVYLTPAFETIYGITREEALGAHDYRTWLDLILPEDREGAAANIAKVREGEKVAFEFRIRRPSDGAIRWMRNTDFPITDDTGKVIMIGGIGHDLTELKQAGEHQQLLLAELQHRVRNTLAVIRSITRRTAEATDSKDAFFMDLDGRIAAFARVQAAVTRDPTRGVDLALLVSEELRVIGVQEGDGFQLSGPEIGLTPKAAETLGIAIHELATNAVKHGALARKGGSIAVTWRVVDGEGTGAILEFSWRERGVALSDDAPRHRGFGTEVLERTLTYELKAETCLDFASTGLNCLLLIPLDQLRVHAVR